MRKRVTNRRSIERQRPFTIGITATSACVPEFELGLGIKRLQELGYQVRVHPVVAQQYRFFAGRDEERIAAFLELARDPEIDAIWCARGGYGALRVIEGIEKAKRIPAGKLLLGYSDVTALLEFVRERWKWNAVHSPMPGTREFSLLPEEDWLGLVEVLQAFANKKTGKTGLPALSHRLEYIGSVRPRTLIEAPLVGGNLTVWDTMVGTRYQGKSGGRILFFEDVTESWYRIDRMLNHLRQSGALKGARALVLGTWSDCTDSAMKVLAQKVPEHLKVRDVLRDPGAAGLALKPLRPTFPAEVMLKEIFGEFSARTGVPVLMGFPAGHGPRYAPIPMGRRWRLEKSGRLSLLDRGL
jgi:muramoyltetrapeptide carboxypeptidase